MSDPFRSEVSAAMARTSVLEAENEELRAQVAAAAATRDLQEDNRDAVMKGKIEQLEQENRELKARLEARSAPAKPRPAAGLRWYPLGVALVAFSSCIQNMGGRHDSPIALVLVCCLASVAVVCAALAVRGAK
jgi:hypothetical protein